MQYTLALLALPFLVVRAQDTNNAAVCFQDCANQAGNGKFNCVGLDINCKSLSACSISVEDTPRNTMLI